MASDRKKTRSFKLPSFSGGTKVIWVIGAVVLYFGMLVAMSTLQARKVNDLTQKVAEAKKESTRLMPQLERIRKLTSEREEVNKRLGVIASLDKNRYFRVQLLNDISVKMPSNCWLTSVKEESASSVSIEGVTFSNYIIADLMNNLQKSDRFDEVSLLVAQEGKILDHNVIEFTLRSQVRRR